MINVLFCLIIVAVAIGIGIREQQFIQEYQTQECNIIEQAIAILKTYQEEKRDRYITDSEVKTGIIKWISQHFKGKSTSQASFKPEQNSNGDFILLYYPSIISKPVPRSPVSFAPALLTAIGILGTFTGIFMGLQDIDLGNISETQNLIAASTKLLAGMKTAFSTSLFGLGTAIFFIIFLSWGIQQRTVIRNGLRRKLSDIAFLENPNHLLSRLDNEGNIEVANTLQSVADNLSGFNADVIANAVQSAIASPDSPLVLELKQIIHNTSGLSSLTPKAIASATSDNFTVLINPLAKEIKQLRELQESQGQTVETLVKQLRNELIEPVVTRLDQSAELTKEASAAVTALKNELGDISTSLAGAVQTIQSFQQDTLTRLQEFAANLQSILGQFRTDTKGVMEQVAIEIKEAVNQSITGMEAQRTAFEASANQASQTFRGIREDLQAALETQAVQQKQMLQDVQTSTESVLVKANEAFVNQSNTLVTVGKEASELMSQTQNNFQSMMKHISLEIKEAVNQSITGMEAQRTAFEASANQASQTFRGIREDLQAALETQAVQQKQMLQEVQNSTEGILVKANEAFVNQSNTLVTVGKEASGLMDEAKDNLLGTLNNIDGMLQNTRLTVQQELEQFRLDYQAALQNFFTQQNDLLNDTLGKQREGLAGVVVDLQQTFNEEATQRKEMSAQVDRSLDRIGETVKTVNTLASAMGMNSSERLGQLQELARTIGGEAHKVERSYQSMTEQFNTALNDGNEKLNDYLKQANETYTRSIQDADEAAAKVCTQLNETSHGLMSVAEFLVSAANDLQNSSGGN